MRSSPPSGWRAGWGSAPFIALPTTVAGVAIGLIDSVHAIERGRFVAVAFAVLTLGALWLMWRQAVLFAWDRSVRRSLTRPVVAAAEPEMVPAVADPIAEHGADSEPQTTSESAARSTVV